MDDHLKCPEGVRRLLGNKHDVVGTIADNKTLMTTARQLRPGVILGDISMPQNGLDGGLKSSARPFQRAEMGARDGPVAD